MNQDTKYQWLKWVQQLQAIAQNGLTYTKDVFDQQRFEEIQKIAAEIAAHHSDYPHEKIVTLFQDQKGYATPKLDVRGAVFQDNKILLVQERSDQLWTLPGGWVDIHDSPSAAVEKEIVEESGYICKAKKLLSILDMNKHAYPPQMTHLYKIFILCEMTGGNPAVSIETMDVRFFAEDDIPPLSIKRTSTEQIKRMYEHKRNPNLPTDFD
jgi:ADP-ribose pyrophosphatase YjhB (NUDIX family)